jgi:uncharacterized protein
LAKAKKVKISAPASSKKLPVLPFFFTLLILAVAGIAGYAYWLGSHGAKNPEESNVANISAAIPGKHLNETMADTTEDKPASKAEETHPKEAASSDKHEMAKEDGALKEEESHSDEPPEADRHSEKDQDSDTAHKSDGTDKDETAHVSEKAADEVSKKEHADEKSEETHGSKTEVAEQTKPVEAESSAQESAAKAIQKPVEKALKSESEPKSKPEPEAVLKKAPPVRVIAEPEVKASLAPVPDPALVTKSDFGLLPIVGPEGQKPWRVYARPFDDPLDRPRIAIIISDMGMSNSATQSAIQNLPGAVTLSFNPYGRKLQDWVEQARAAGHEALLQLPMEPFGYPQNDPGPQSLLTRLTDKENIKRLDWMLGRFTGYAGVTNQMGSRFTALSEEITPVLNVLKSRGLLYVDGRTSAKSVAGPLAAQLNVPVAINNRFLDNRADRTSIDDRLAELEKIARITGTAVGIGYPYPVTLERLAAWSQTLNRKGIVLAPISAVINRQEIQ